MLDYIIFNLCHERYILFEDLKLYNYCGDGEHLEIEN